jgi:PST family polysaccharide transporter
LKTSSLPGAAAVAEPPPANAATSSKALDGQLVRGLAWTGGMKWAVQGITWLSTLVVARILTPEDYGLIAMSAVYLGIVTVLSEFGLGTSVVVMRALKDDQIAQINGLAVLAGLAGLVLSVFAAYPLGMFFDAPQLPPVVMLMSTTFLITGFYVVPAAIMNRDLRFRELALIDGLTGAILAIAMVGFALAGLRYWTLVLGYILSALCRAAFTLARQRHAIAWPRRSAIGSAISLSSDVVITRLTWYLYSNADFLVAGRVLGKTALGAYSMGWTLASVPVEKVTALVVNVTPAFFSAVQKDMAAVRRYLLILTEGLSLVVVPAAIGLALVADDFVLAILGEHWRDGILPLRLLALYAAVRAVSPLFSPILTALGRTRSLMWISVFGVALLPTAFVIGSRWGTTGIAATWLVAHPIIIGLSGRLALRMIGLPVTRYLRALWPAISAAAIMTAAVIATRAFDIPDGSSWTRLLVEASTGAVAYAAVLVAFYRDRLRAFRAILRHLSSPAEAV